MTDQTISTPETREREVAALKHQVRDIANERNKAEQDVRTLRAEVDGLKLALKERALLHERSTAQLAQVETERDEWHVNATHHYEAEKILEQQLAAERVKTLEEVARHCDGTSAFSHPLLDGLAAWCRAKAKGEIDEPR